MTSPLPLSFRRRGVPAGGVRILIIDFISFSLLSWGNFGFLLMLSFVGRVLSPPPWAGDEKPDI